MLTVLATTIGVLMIATALRDVFDALFHESGRGVLSPLVMRGVWRLFHRVRRPRALSIAGPAALIVVVGVWVVLLAVGWALILWPHIDTGFTFSSELRGEDRDAGFGDALYLSLVTLATVGYGDITPADGWLRIVTPLEALVGFGLLTASISWLLSIYPVLLRRRSLAYEIWLLREGERKGGTRVTDLDPDAAEDIYAELTSRLVAVERDFVSFPIAYYFGESNDRFALSRAMPYLLDLAERGGAAGSDRVRLRRTILGTPIDDFAATTASRFHGRRGGTTAERLRAYAHDHGHDDAPGAGPGAA